MNLYQLTNELRESLDSAFDPETGEALPVFEERRALWGSKARDVMAYMLNVDSDIDQLDRLLKSIKARKDAAVKKSLWLEGYLSENMKASGISKLKADDGSFEATLFVDRDESVVIEDGAKFPLELCNAPKQPEPSKSLIKAAILRGEAIAGAKIVYKDRLTIK